MIAEYERAKLLERSRRGKRHAAQEGRVGILCHAPRGRPAHSRRGYSGKAVPPDEWITIPVPALVEAALFDTVQAQLDENRRRARIPEKGSRYLLPDVHPPSYGLNL